MDPESSGEFVFSTTKEKPPDNNKKTTSFRDKVIGNIVVPPPRSKIDLFEKKLARIEYHENNPLLPMVHLDDSVFEGLSTPWKDALVVKLLGKSIGYLAMKERLQRIWKPMAGFDVMDLGNGFFMVKFDEESDRTNVINGGPWMIYDHYLTVQCWSQDFTAPTATIDRTMVWVRFPGLNLFYYDESVLMALAAAVGRPIKVDQNTLDVRRGQFARICVEIELNKPVIGKVWLRNHWYEVEYEGLHRICSTCGCYGHLTRECKKNVVEASTLSHKSTNS